MHYGVYVLIPEHGDPGWHVKHKMAPYNENIDLPTRREFEPCEDEAEHRRAWENDPVKLVRLPSGKRVRPWDERVEHKPYDETLKLNKDTLEDGYTHVVGTHKDLYKTFDAFMKAEGYEMHQGRYGYWHNPDGHWDWWQIGGRWSGMLDGYEPRDDPKNRESCRLCEGTGMRNDDLGKKWREENPEYTCNGCSGTGTSIKWPTEFEQRDGDVQPASVVRELDDYPHALVDMEGKWHTIGWTNEESDREAWKGFVKDVLASHDGRVVIVDCHT